MMLMLIIIIVIIIAIIIIMIKIILIIALVIIINGPFQPSDFSTGSTTEALEFLMDLFRSFICNRKRRSPRTEPCQTPV